MNPFDTTIDLDEIHTRNGDTVVNAITLMFAGDTLDEAEKHERGMAFQRQVLDSLKDISVFVGEIKRLREQRQKTRDIHSPANSSDPAAPGAICTGCSMHGSRVPWPCPTWNATEDGR